MHFSLILSLAYAATANALLVNATHTSSDLAAIEARSGVIQKRECYGSGTVWGGDKQFALAAIADACNERELADRDYLNGDWTKSCKGLPNDRRVDYKIRAKTNRWVSRTECNEYLRFEVDACEKGGEREYYGVVFRYVCPCQNISASGDTNGYI
jgi:hypothetical protein